MCNDETNKPGMIMTGAITILANVAAYFTFKKLKAKKTK